LRKQENNDIEGAFGRCHGGDVVEVGVSRATACLQPQLLHQHVSGRRHQHAQLVGIETRATGAVDLQTYFKFLDAVFDITARAVDLLIDELRRGLQVGDNNEGVVPGVCGRDAGQYRP